MFCVYFFEFEESVCEIPIHGEFTQPHHRFNENDAIVYPPSTHTATNRTGRLRNGCKWCISLMDSLLMHVVSCDFVFALDSFTGQIPGNICCVRQNRDNIRSRDPRALVLNPQRGKRDHQLQGQVCVSFPFSLMSISRAKFMYTEFSKPPPGPFHEVNET